MKMLIHNRLNGLKHCYVLLVSMTTRLMGCTQCKYFGTIIYRNHSWFIVTLELMSDGGGEGGGRRSSRAGLFSERAGVQEFPLAMSYYI